jgi:hypothetical protein
VYQIRRFYAGEVDTPPPDETERRIQERAGTPPLID